MTWAENGLSGNPDIRRVTVAKVERRQYSNDIIASPTGTVGSGGNSGFQAVNLAVQFGARQIILVGFDMQGDATHWYGRNQWHGANNPTRHNFEKWVNAFRRAAPQFRKLGVDIVNTSMASAIDVFPKMPLPDAIDRWL
jgi:hypothetical protein